MLVGVFAVVLATFTGAYLVTTASRPTVSAAPVVPEVRRFTLALHGIKAGDETMRHWMPGVVVVNEGDTVILRVTNSDPDSAHGFALAGYNISVPTVAPGQTVTARFRATRPGIYAYGCMLAGCAADHADQAGQFVVLGK
ncbi:MAG: hypothetical protein QN149_13360 [Armatimonadota bacterium]|nr:hypothetical protein [Armatimonadota bacterium]